MSLLNWVAPLVGLAGAALVAGANFFVQRWRYKIDRLSAAVGELSLEVNAAADIATHYWLLDTSQHPEQREARALETQLIGRQTRLQELVLALKAQDESLKLDDVEEGLADLYAVMTGGAFKVSGRSPDGDAAQGVQTVAATLNGRLRRAITQIGRAHV